MNHQATPVLSAADDRPGANRKNRFLSGTAMAAAALLVTGCGGFGGESATGSDASGEGASGPELSEPPAIEGDVVAGCEERTIDFGIGLAESSPQYLSVEYFGDILEERTEGQFSVNIFPNSQVGDDKEMMSALQSGSLGMTMPSTSPATTLVPELRVFDLPFLFPEAEDADEVLDSAIGDEMLAKFDGTGIKALAWAENGYRQLTNSVRPVESPADVEGLRLRVMENPIQIDVWSALGANPTAMAFGEVFSALEQGVVDGQENPWPTIYSSKFYEVQDYGSSTRHVYTPFVWMMSQELYDSMSPECQQVVTEAAEAAGAYNRTISREYSDFALQQLIDSGMEITDLSPEQLAAFKDATQPVYDEWAPQIGEDLVSRVQGMVEDN